MIYQQELVSKLHEEVLAEYVRKMMKKKIKFKDEKKQQQAAETLCGNSQKIHNLFTEAVSFILCIILWPVIVFLPISELN